MFKEVISIFDSRVSKCWCNFNITQKS
jgi:hypothetical protein